MKKKMFLPKSILILLVASFLFACGDEDDAATPISNDPTTFEIISESPDHTILEDLLLSSGLDQALNSGIYTVFAPTDSAFGNIDTSNLSDSQLKNILLNHVVQGAAESSNLFTTYLNTLAVESLSGVENNLSLYVNVGTDITLNGQSVVTGPDNLASNGVVHIVDEVITIPDVTTFAIADPTFGTLVEALTLDGQPDFVATLSSFEAPAPFTVFAPTNDAFVIALVELGVESLTDIDPTVLTSILNTHVIANANITLAELESGTIETLGETFELDAPNATITDQNGRTIAIVVTDVQAGNGVVHVVSSVILPDLNLDPPPSANSVEMTVGNNGVSSYFVSNITGNETVTPLNEANSSWILTEGTRYKLTITGANSHPFELRNSNGDALLSQSNEGSFEADTAVDFQTDGQQFDFTVTPELAAELNKYFCTIHSGMNGMVSVQ
jgi:transforming growth factor-beta-induced protein